ncbi:MAG: insulinase family protein, partial [Acidobacteriota bacterium]|nr:insulinase family protein [Acidobacteriota bacterium]
MRMLRTFQVAALAVLAATTPASAQLGSDGINIPFERMTLPNGLEVILSTDHTVPQVAVDVWYHVGSKNEVPGRTGFAHLFEHVMFTGSGHVPYGLHDRLTEGVGGTNNGETTNDRTNYFEIVPSNYLETALWLESDRMGFLLDKLDEGKFKAQRDIVQNERRQVIDNQPYGRAWEILSVTLYPESNPYSWPGYGYMADLQKAGIEDVKAFFRMYYAPSNATIAIVGDFEPAQAKAWVAAYFGDLKRGVPITRPKVAPVALAAEKRLVFEDRVQIPRLDIAWPSAGDDN